MKKQINSLSAGSTTTEGNFSSPSIETGNHQIKKKLSLKELEEMRTKSVPVPASKNGLESICGASSEVSAQ